jgi:predicted enzyme related to lactoylglutathione lyase
MPAPPTALIPFVPSGKDFDAALAFFAELGFAVAWRVDDLAGLRAGTVSFVLQRIDVPTWQQNQMHQLQVEDLDAWWRDIAAKDLPARFAGVRIRPPTDFPWGREVHIVDPAGVCWHLRQAPKA